MYGNCLKRAVAFLKALFRTSTFPSMRTFKKTDHAKTVDVMFFSFKAMPGGKERGRNESPRLLVTQPFKVHIAAKTKIILRESINQMMDIAFSHTLHASIMISYFVKM